MATPFEVNMKEIDLLKRIERLKKELVEKEEMIRERENVIREREDELKEKDRTLDEKEEELSFWQKSVKTTREKGDKIADEFKFMFERREEDLKEKLAIREREFDEQLQTLEDQKEKMRLLEEKERSEREESFRKRMREIDQREKEIEKRERQMKKEREHEEFISNINRLAPHSVYHNTISEKVEDRKGSKIQNSPTPPKLSTYDGKTEWKPYYIQFNHIAKKYMWNEREKLDKMIECLREKALKFFSSRPENVQKDFKLLCQKFKESFDRKDQSHIIRRQLQEIQQKTDETLEEFAERIEDLSTEAYPDSPEFFRSTITIDAFLRGCLEKRAALVTLDKDPKTLDEAVQHMKSAVTNQKLIMGTKKDIRRVTFEEKDDIPNTEDVNIRLVNKVLPKTTPSLESRISTLENDNKETKRLLREILERMKMNEVERESRPRFRSTQRSPIKYNRSRSNSSERGSECFKCGKEGHFARNCSHRQNRSSRFRSPSSVHGYLNSHELRK